MAGEAEPGDCVPWGSVLFAHQAAGLRSLPLIPAQPGVCEEVVAAKRKERPQGPQGACSAPNPDCFLGSHHPPPMSPA